MPLECHPTEIPEVLHFTPQVFRDQRGYFMELFHRDRYAAFGLGAQQVQSNISYSTRGVLRGMHFQLRQPQAKLIQTLRGEIFDVAVDVRRGSPTFGRWVGRTLSDRDGAQLFVPEGFAHGFQVLSDEAIVLYQCSDVYAPGDEVGVVWNDPALAIDWPLKNVPPILAPRDRDLPTLDRLPADRLPVWTPPTP